MQVVEVDAIYLQSLQASFAGFSHPFRISSHTPLSIRRDDVSKFGGDLYLVPDAFDRLFFFFVVVLSRIIISS
jgi:hypothetical protein